MQNRRSEVMLYALWETLDRSIPPKEVGAILLTQGVKQPTTALRLRLTELELLHICKEQIQLERVEAGDLPAMERFLADHARGKTSKTCEMVAPIKAFTYQRRSATLIRFNLLEAQLRKALEIQKKNRQSRVAKIISRA